VSRSKIRISRELPSNFANRISRDSSDHCSTDGATSAESSFYSETRERIERLHDPWFRPPSEADGAMVRRPRTIGPETIELSAVTDRTTPWRLLDHVPSPRAEGLRASRCSEPFARPSHRSERARAPARRNHRSPRATGMTETIARLRPCVAPWFEKRDSYVPRWTKAR